MPARPNQAGPGAQRGAAAGTISAALPEAVMGAEQIGKEYEL